MPYHRVPSVPVKKHIENDEEVVKKPKGNKRLNSNVGNWDPDIKLLQSSEKWIGVGLRIGLLNFLKY